MFVNVLKKSNMGYIHCKLTQSVRTITIPLWKLRFCWDFCYRPFTSPPLYISRSLLRYHLQCMSCFICIWTYHAILKQDYQSLILGFIVGLWVVKQTLIKCDPLTMSTCSISGWHMPNAWQEAISMEMIYWRSLL